MNSELWLDALARRARQEPTPELCLLPPQLPVARPVRGPRPAALWFSGAASLAVASIVLAIGLHVQSAASTTASTSSTNSMSVLFAPLDTSTP